MHILIHPRFGSRIIFSGILTDMEFISDTPVKDLCTHCNLCVDNCPGDALHDEGKTHLMKCLKNSQPYGISTNIRFKHNFIDSSPEKQKEMVGPTILAALPSRLYRLPVFLFQLSRQMPHRKEFLMQKQTLIEKITAFVLASPENSYNREYRYYDAPLIGFADANDPIFTLFKDKTIVGPIFRLPTEWLPEAATVISFFMPSTTEIRKSNHPSDLASDPWMHARFKGDAFINQVRRYAISEIEKAGGLAMAPHMEPTFYADFEIYASNWSERHVAYAAGLGTFSLNRGLITEKGMAGRIGSIVTNLQFEPTPRKYSDPFENCLFHRNSTCEACIKRCPAQAISENGKDKYLCHQYLFFTNPRKDFNEIHGYPYSACGKCQTKVPCEHKIP